MKPGDQVTIKATVLRIDGERVDAQTPNGQLIQTSIENVMPEEKQPELKKEEKPKPKVAQGYPAGAENKSVDLSEHKAILNSPENKNQGGKGK